MNIDSENISSQMRKGMLEYCVLLILAQGPHYPSEIISALSEADMIVVEGTLYTLLNRLRREEKLTYEWQESPKGPPRKYYSLTQTGHDTLKAMSCVWDGLASAISHFRNPQSSQNS
ncbi:MAG: PadR family transcriptional regulator [Muribaculaceae bacterium]|nr:PadR family transcriptional regulator [Muribaculaceae bacterium]